MVASVWDGIANFGAGLLVDRKQGTFRYGPLLAAGAVPLGLSFIITYFPPRLAGLWAIAIVFAAHLLFRTFYAAVNVPYLAMTARISGDPSDRAFVAGMRMLFGTAASVVVALSTVPVGRWLAGSSTAQAYFGAAALFAVIGTAILVLVGMTYRDSEQPRRPVPANTRAVLASLSRNGAFLALNGAIMAVIVAMTVLSKSVLYYFKYLLAVPHAGEIALAWMGLVGGIAIPFWMILGRLVGLRSLWLVAVGIGIAELLVFIAIRLNSVGAMQTFLAGMQVVAIGAYFIFWAMLPNTIEYGERETGLHVEGAVFGVAALLQRIAIGIATAILGWSFDSVGYVANVQQSSVTLAGMRATVVGIPLLFLALSWLAMLFNPLGRKGLASGDEVEAPVDALALR
jgi:GPH family glycoside/pentoside/hexuronide:cation symporter